MSFSVVILSARAQNLLPCVRAILAAEPNLTPERIIVVDDGARHVAEAQLPSLRWVQGITPFVFACNANLGIRAAGTDVILLNDDALLCTPGGFTRLAEQIARRPEVGICSAAVRGVVGNPRQRPQKQRQLRLEQQMLAFVCVYIPSATFAAVGPLDERFTGYGFDDNDYCARVRASGRQLAIWDGCVVDHSGALPSTFRTRPDLARLFAHNRRLHDAKQHEYAADGRRVDLLYLACNRLEYTRETFAALAANTDWGAVRELVVYDDGSQDGTGEWLSQAVGDIPAAVRFERTRFGSPVTAMRAFIRRAQAPILAKVDNDAMMPPGWLAQSLAVLDRHPDLDLLGLEALYPHDADPQVARGYTPAEFVSGIGLYRRATFARSQPAAFRKYFGLEEWQVAQGARVKRGWITPALPVFLLDRIPIEPWAGLSAGYVQRGWQRPQPFVYDAGSTLWRWHWPSSGAALASTNIEPRTKNQEPPDEHLHASVLSSSDTAESAAPQASEPVLPSRATARRLNFCFCDTLPEPGYENIQVLPFPKPGEADLRAPWPWPDDTFAHVRAYELAEHLPDKLHTINELWRVLAHGGTVELAVPTTDGSGAFQDPTHVSFWNRQSFGYFEASAPERARLARRSQLRAAFTIVQERTEHSIDGPRLTIALRAIKSAATVAAIERPRFLGALRIKNEAQHIREVIERILPLCERVLIFDDHSTDDTVAICRSFGERVTVLSSPFEGLDEARDKTYLLERIVEADPEWVLWIDGDEVLERSGPAKLRAAASSPGVAAYALQIAYVWNDPQHIRVDGIYGHFTRPSLFRLRGQPLQLLHFPASGFGGNFHCGNVPRGLVGAVSPIDVRLKHFGYMTREQRQRKYAWYNTIDPHNDFEDRYRHIAEIPGARYAPGPPRIVPWRE